MIHTLLAVLVEPNASLKGSSDAKGSDEKPSDLNGSPAIIERLTMTLVFDNLIKKTPILLKACLHRLCNVFATGLRLKNN